MAAESQSDRKAAQKAPLPFEVTKKRKKTNNPDKLSQTAKNSPSRSSHAKKTEKLAAANKNSQKQQSVTTEMAVPKVVSDRMVRRMAWLCGIPSMLGMATFVVSYLTVSHGFKLPHFAVVLTSMGFFGLGVLGLSYGVISASWDEEIAGSKLGWREFVINWERLLSAWRSNREKKV